jgi:hypothetical protein
VAIAELVFRLFMLTANLGRLCAGVQRCGRSRGAAPATPAFITPANNAQFHLFETYPIQWSAVAGAQYYVLEADDEPTFPYPLTLTLSTITFGTQSGGDWANALTVYYRSRAVSVDGIRSLPSARLTVIAKVTTV